MLPGLLSNGLSIKIKFFLFFLTYFRDSDDSAPPLYPPEQPEADIVADGEEYGAEEPEEEEEEEEDVADGADGAADPDAMIDDAENTGNNADPSKAVEEESDAGSEDLEAESSGSEEEEVEEEEEREDEVMELDNAENKDASETTGHPTDAIMTH